MFIDFMHHRFNPVLHPFVKDYFDALMQTNDWTSASAIAAAVLIALLIYFFVDETRKGTRDFWIRILVG